MSRVEEARQERERSSAGDCSGIASAVPSEPWWISLTAGNELGFHSPLSVKVHPAHKAPGFPRVKGKSSSGLRAVLQRRAAGTGYWEINHREEVGGRLHAHRDPWRCGTLILPAIEGHTGISTWGKKGKLTGHALPSSIWSCPISRSLS